MRPASDTGGHMAIKPTVEVVIDVPVEVWIEAARGGSQEALGRALELYRDTLQRMAERELGRDLQTKEGVSDLVQGTFLEAHRDFEKFTGRTRAEWSAWLRGIMRHNLGHLARRYRTSRKRLLSRERPLDGADSRGGLAADMAADTPSPSEHAIKHEQTDMLRQALGRLSPRDRLILLWRTHDQLTFHEIGRRLGCSGVAAYKAWVRAVERLKRDPEHPLGDLSTSR
jgi:RNA polymerase sigma-70 factor, ECF subfamily